MARNTRIESSSIRWFGGTLASLTLASLAACSSAPKRDAASAMPVAPATSTAVSSPEQAPQNSAAIADAVVSSRVARRPAGKRDMSVMPVVINDDVRRWVQKFASENSEMFRRFLERGLVYREMVETTLAKYGLPKELYFLAMIESGYVTSAKSHANAVGVWQFIRGTGTRYGLDSDYYIDERRDPVRATEAAARYLRDLYTVFQDWYLAMAAYNAGEMRVLGGIMRGNTRDFWGLSEQKKLPPETRDYVPKFLAALIIGRNPERFGFHNLQAEKMPALASVEVPSPVRLKDVALITGVDYEQLLAWNQGVRRGVTPPGRDRYSIWVPAAQQERVAAAQPLLSKRLVQGMGTRRNYAESRRGVKYHRVKSGETLYSIARRHGVSVEALKRANGLRSNKIAKGARLRVAAQGGVRRARVGTYQVRSGDNLTSIARRFGMSVAQLKSINNLQQNRIYKGQNLRVARGNI